MGVVGRVLIANRGEIASRIIRTCRRLGIGTVAVFSDADTYAPYVRQADSAWPLTGNAAAETYLRMAKDKTPIEDILALLNDPEHMFTTKVTPIDSMIQFMARTGNFKNKPTKGAELLFPEAQQ
mgnify:CR=1 FL=1